jgi:hypothetical protein
MGEVAGSFFRVLADPQQIFLWRALVLVDRSAGFVGGDLVCVKFG